MKKGLIILIIAFLSELSFLSFYRGKAGIYISPIIILIASLIVGLIPILYPIKHQENAKAKTVVNLKLVLWILFGVFSFITALLLRKIFLETPVSIEVSDVIPTVDVLSKRLLNGEFPYKIITEFGYDLPPTYLTFQWLPFIFSSLLGIDHRWIPLIVWLASVAFYAHFVIKKNKGIYWSVFAILLPFFIIWVFINNLPSIFENTIELLPVAYYLFLSLCLLQSNIWKTASGFTLTLLSRYSLLFWIPLYFVIHFFSKERKNVIRIALITFLFGVIFYIIPFFARDPGILKRGFQYYSKAALGEWVVKDFQKPTDKPFHLFKGVGFASYFYNFYPGSLSQKLNALKTTHIFLSVAIIFVLLFLYFLLKQKIEMELFMLGSLKIYLSFFYCFIQVPYVYLFLVPLFLSVIILIEYSSRFNLVLQPNSNPINQIQ